MNAIKGLRILGASVLGALLTVRTSNAASITVNSLADPGATGICALRDAITAANTKTATNGCAAGTGQDTINFSVIGTILPAGTGANPGTLPQITDSNLTIKGPITIDGSASIFEVMTIAVGATVTLRKVTITNTFDIASGAVTNDGTLTVTNSTFSNNNSANSPGAILNDGTLTITNSTFTGNRSKFGAVIDNFESLTVTNSTFYNNGGTRGGVIINVGTAAVTNSTFFQNTCGFGTGGGINNIGTLTVTSSTFFENSCAGGVSGILNSGSANLKGTILGGGTFGGGSAPNCSGTITDAGYDISDDSSCGFTATGSAHNGDGINPELSPDGLADNGGPTQTIALVSGSPAIDTIPVADCTDQNSIPITTDQRGFPRPDFGEDVCDIGSYESQEAFAGTPKAKNCHGKSVSGLTDQFGNFKAAASALGFPSVKALQNAIRTFCEG